MKSICILMGLICSYTVSFCQTNTFPTDGNVGVGTVSPIYKLDVIGSFRFGGSASYSSMLMGVESTPLPGYNQTNYMLPLTIPGSGTARTAFRLKNNLYGAGQNVLDLLVDGNIGIGVEYPTHALTVKGDVKLTGEALGYLIRYASLSETVGGASTILGNNVKAGITDNTIKKSNNNSDAGSYVSLNYQSGITFHTGVMSGFDSDVHYSGYEAMRINHYGDVGIGTTNPFSKVHITSTLSRTQDGITKPNLNVFSDNTPSVGTGGVIALGGKSGNSSADYPFAYVMGGKESNLSDNYAGYFAINTVSSGGNGEVNSGNYERLRITSTGNVGIGTADPKGYKLAVAGNMIAESVKVKLQGAWPDYVFAPSYKVPTLQEIEKHIKEKGHLQGIPSSSEVKANGIDIGDMNAKLLQKIEELTLHLIEMKKEIESLKDKAGSNKNN